MCNYRHTDIYIYIIYGDIMAFSQQQWEDQGKMTNKILYIYVCVLLFMYVYMTITEGNCRHLSTPAVTWLY